MCKQARERRESRRRTAFSDLADDFNRLDVAADNAPRTPTQRPTAPLANPFAPGYASRQPDGMSDMSMEDVSGSPHVLNAPALPPAPVYKGSTMADRRRFMRDYLTYVNALNAFQTSVHRPFVMPVGACIDGDTRRRIALFRFGGNADAVTEEQ